MATHAPTPAPWRLAAISAGVLGVGVGAAFVLSWGHWSPPSVPALVVAALLTSLHVRPHRNLAATDNIEYVHLDEVLFVPMLILLSPLEVFATVALATLAGSVTVRRGLVKTAFNIGQFLVAFATAVVVITLLGGSPPHEVTLLNVSIGMLGALIATACSAAIVRSMVAYATGADSMALVKDIVARLGPWLGAITLGGVGSLAYAASPYALPLVVILVIFVQRAYGSAMREVAARRDAERLQRATASLRTQRTPEAVTGDLVRAVRDLLGARDVRVVGHGSNLPMDAIAASLGPEHVLYVARRIGAGDWTAQERQTLETLAGVAGDVLRATQLIAELRTITHSQSEGIIAIDLQARVTFANPAAVSMTGHNQESDLLDQQLTDVCALKHGKRSVDFERMVADETVAKDVDAVLLGADLTGLDVAYSITPLRMADTHSGAVLVLRDITERRALQNTMAHRALHDELTGLPNRRLLLDRLDHALARLTKSDGQHGLLFLDLDRFKLVNDSHGHLIGDRLLIQVAHRLRRNLSGADTVARFSGDEFVVLIEDVPDTTALRNIAERLRKAIEPPFRLGDVEVHISVAIGVATALSGHSRDDVLAAADTAAYAAKAAGRNTIRLASDDLLEQARTRLHLEAQLRDAIESNQLDLHFQPIVTTRRGRVVGVEALVRWNSDHRGVVMPNQFIPLAEESGLIVPLGQWVLERACRTVQGWTEANPDRHPLMVSVNLSAMQFASPALANQVATSLKESGLAPSQLCLEITESVLMTDTTTALRSVQALRDLGVRVAIDDFGTGYSSLSYLKHLTVDAVKLDGSFTAGLDQDLVDAEIVGAVLRLASALGIDTIAEGVETLSQWRVLEQMGCPLIQGFITARPLKTADFLEFWDERAKSLEGVLDGT